MNEMKPIDTGEDEARIARIRADAMAVVKAHYPSQAAAARDAGIKESTFSAWLNDTYAGDNAKVAADAAKWLAARVEREKAQAILPTAPGFQLTPTARKMLPVLQFAQALPDFAVITTAPGCGKTTLLEHYRDNTPNVWLATLDPDTKGVNRMLGEICRAMGITEHSASKLSQAVGNRVKGVQGLTTTELPAFDTVQAPSLTTTAIDSLTTARLGALTTAAEPAAQASPVAAALAGLEDWFASHVPNSVLSQDTALHNRISNAVAEIKSALASVKE
jgi:hypothetical protein